MAKWLSSIFYEVKTFEKMPEGEYYWFDDIEDFPQFKDSVFLFTLPLNDPNYRTTKETIKIGAIKGVLVDDLRLFMANTEIAVDKLNDDKTEGFQLQKSPAFTYPALHNFGHGLTTFSGSTGFHGEPIDMDMQPLFRYFRVRVIVNETLRFQNPIMICITVDSYKKIAEQT